MVGGSFPPGRETKRRRVMKNWHKKCPSCGGTIPYDNWKDALISLASQEHQNMMCDICDRLTGIMDWMGTDKESEGNYKKAQKYDLKEAIC
jgi:hypothetical protein